jgi:hypothetical protein
MGLNKINIIWLDEADKSSGYRYERGETEK